MNRSALESPLLLVKNLSIHREDREHATPQNLSFTIDAGECVLLLGPSGSGKSTVAMSINGLIPHAINATVSGSVIVNGENTLDHSVAALSEHVGMVFQDPETQIVTTSLLDEVCFGPENLQLPIEEIRERAQWALTQVGLWERRFDNPDSLSGGGKQRLAIACALALKPKILVLDEPTANLDPVGIDEVYAVLTDLVEAGEHAILLIEHNLDAAIDLVDRVVALDRHGRMILEGPLRKVLPNRFPELIAHGVWLPAIGLAGRIIQNAGVPLAPLPLTPEELTTQLDGFGELPAPNLVEHSPQNGDQHIISATNLTITKRKKPLIQGVNLNVIEGEFLCIIGTNGAGKTTLIRALAGVIKPPKGHVITAGKDPAKTSPKSMTNRVGYVFQNPEHQFITHTVFDELAHPLRLQQSDEKEIRLRVGEMLERFGLNGLEQSHPFLLSGGQKRRLSVGTALITGAPILILDEPTFGQDRDRANELLRLLKELNRSGTTVIAVSHDMQLVAEHADRVAVMHEGKLIRLDNTLRVFRDGALLAESGMKLPPLTEAMRELRNHPEWNSIVRMSELPSPRVQKPLTEDRQVTS